MVSAFPRAGGRPSPHGKAGDDLDPAARTLDGADRTLREPVPRPRTVSAFVAPTEDLDQAPLGHEAVRAQDAGDDLDVGVEYSSVSRFTTTYSTRNGFLKPFAFGVRRWIGVWPPSKPGAMLFRAPLALGAAVGGLAALAGDAAPDPSARRSSTRGAVSDRGP